MSSLEETVLSDCPKKPMSVLYSHQCFVTLREISILWKKWLVDIPDLDRDDWSDIWDLSFKQLVSLRDRFIQFKIIH